MFKTNAVTQIAKVTEKIFIIVQFQTDFDVIGAYNYMVMEVVSVNMAGDNCFVIFEFFKPLYELHPNLICLLRRDGFTDLEGLNEVIESHAVRLMTKYFLRGKEGLVRQLRDAIVARNIGELFALIKGF